MEQHFSEILGNSTLHNLASYNRILQNLSPRISVPFEFVPENFQDIPLNGEPRKFCKPSQTMSASFALVSNASEFLVDWKAPQYRRLFSSTKKNGLKYSIFHLSCVHGLDLIGSKFWQQNNTQISQTFSNVLLWIHINNTHDLPLMGPSAASRARAVRSLPE